MNLFQKLSAISNEIGTVEKELKVAGYKAVSERSVLEAVKPLEAKYGVYSYPCNRSIAWQEVVDGNVIVRVVTTYRFINMDDPTEFIDVTSMGDGVDKMDKASGKAMTYADKYALMKAYKIVTGDDPDAIASESIFAKEEETPRAKLTRLWMEASQTKKDRISAWAMNNWNETIKQALQNEDHCNVLISFLVKK